MASGRVGIRQSQILPAAGVLIIRFAIARFTMALGVLWLGPIGFFSQATGAQSAIDGRRLYEVGCASCHGMDGAGAPRTQIAFDDPLPDLSDCDFAVREPDLDWILVAKGGGPVRAFSEIMPAFAEAFSDSELQAIIDYIRTFCTDPSWPKGELNLPRALFTGKAYPSDEWAWRSSMSTEGTEVIAQEFKYEHRVGPRSQVEVVLPFTINEIGDGPNFGLGNVELGFKHVVMARGGSILSGKVEVDLPAGSSGAGWQFLRGGPSLLYGQMLGDIFALQMETGVTLSTARHETPHLGRWAFALGGVFASSEYGRMWAPMVEVVGRVGLEDHQFAQWDVIPQLKFTLNRRQHVSLTLGVRAPITETQYRATELIAYFTWDWFDGGLFDGW